MGKRILLVDDDASFVGLVVPLLEAQGHIVYSVRNASAATRALREVTPDVVIVDGLLPDVNGITWLQQLGERASELQLIFVSAFWRDLDAYQRLTQLGVSLVLHKPVSPDVFRAQLEQVLGRTEAAAAPEASTVLQKLRADYGRTLPDKLHALLRACELAARAPHDAALAAEARALAHRLRGTAGSYGFDTVSELGEAVETLLLAPEGKPPAERVWPDVLQRVQAGLRTATHAPLATPSSEPTATSSGSAKAAWALHRVLVVSPDASDLARLTEQARQRLIDVLGASSAQAALVHAERGAFDAALIDLALGPEAQSAFALANALRALPGQPRLPLAFLSSDHRLENRIASAHAGASLLLDKPLDADALSLAVHQLASERHAQRGHVLLVDDDPEFGARASAALAEEGLDVTVLRTPADALRMLDETQPDLLLLDAMMPGLSGFDVCRGLRTSQRWQDLPVLFLTAKHSVESRIEAFRAGADDYLLKPVVDEELRARVRLRLDRVRLLRDRSELDALTGLMLRRRFISSLNNRLFEAQRKARPLALCRLDLDHFKLVNDVQGHLAGDQVLASLGALLARRFRAGDLRGRWGGTEFVLAFPEETAHTAQAILERVQSELRETSFHGERGPFRVTFSAGVAAAPDDGGTLSALVQAAERRLERAKAEGRNRVEAKDAPARAAEP